MTSSAPPRPEAPPVDPPPAPAPAAETWLGWLFLAGLAVVIALLDPLVIDLQHRQDVSLILLAGGAGLLALGEFGGRPLATWAGALLLWAEIAGGVVTQIAPLGLAPGLVWAPRGGLLAVALVGWVFFLGAPAWMRQGTLAAAVPTLGLFGALWLTASPISHSAGLYWVVVDSAGTLYATDTDNGAIWLFDFGGGVRGKLWPGLAGATGTPGPGIKPAGAGSALVGPLASRTPLSAPLVYRQFAFCGLAVDPQHNVYVIDYVTVPTAPRLVQFDPDGQLRAAWMLPDQYRPARGCVAADATHVYVGDNFGLIDVYDHQGHLQARWTEDVVSLGLAAPGGDRLVVLHQTSVEVLHVPDGKRIVGWNLPPPVGYLEVPYQAIAVAPDGTVLVTNVTGNELLRYSANGTKLPSLGGPGGWPGQFSGLGGVATDSAGRVYIADLDHRVVQRFMPDGAPTAVWSAPEDEAGE